MLLLKAESGRCRKKKLKNTGSSAREKKHSNISDVCVITPFPPNKMALAEQLRLVVMLSSFLSLE